MTGPDRIWVNWKPADDEHPPNVVGAATVYSHINTMAYPVEYIRRDPATLAALPEVQAMIAAAYEGAAKACDRIAGNVKDFARDHRRAAGQCAAAIRATSGASNSAAALAQIEARAEARGRVVGLREAAEWVRPQRNDVTATGEEFANAILARAAEIEKDVKC